VEAETFALQPGGEQGCAGRVGEGLWQRVSALGQDFGDKQRAAKVLSAPILSCRSKAAEAEHKIYPGDKLPCSLQALNCSPE